MFCVFPTMFQHIILCDIACVFWLFVGFIVDYFWVLFLPLLLVVGSYFLQKRDGKKRDEEQQREIRKLKKTHDETSDKMGAVLEEIHNLKRWATGQNDDESCSSIPVSEEDNTQGIGDDAGIQEVKQTLNEALVSLRKGEHEIAIEKFEHIAQSGILKESEEAKIWAKMGKILIGERDNPSDEDASRALKFYNKAVSLCPDRHDYLNDRGNARSLRGDFDGALADYSSVLTAEPQNINTLINRGLVYLDISDYEKAEVDLNKASELEADSFNAVVGLGLVKMETGDLISARKLFGRANKISDGYFLTHESIALIDSIEGDRDASLENRTKAIKLAPDNPVLRVNRAEDFADLGHFDEALADYNIAISLDSSLAAAFNGRGTIYSEKNLLDSAIDDFNRAIELDDSFLGAPYNLGVVLVKKQQYQLAEDAFSKAISLSKSWPQAYLGRGEARSRLGKYIYALADVDACLSEDSGLLSAYKWRGIARGNLDMFHDAATDFTTYLASRPDDHEVLLNRAKVLFEMGQFKEVIEDTSKIISIIKGIADDATVDEPWNEIAKEAFLWRIQAHCNLKNFAEAETDIEFMLSREQEDPYTHLNMGIVQSASGKQDMALASLRYARELFSKEGDTKMIEEVDRHIFEVAGSEKNEG